MRSSVFFVLAVLAFMACIVFSENKPRCHFSRHIRKSNWKFDGMRDFRGERTYTRPLPVVSPFTNGTQEELNKQINRELFAHYTYLSMAYHFQRDDIHRPGFYMFFKKQSEEEHKHAQLLMEYQNKRGGRIKFNNIKKPCKDEWGSGLEAMREALYLEKDIYTALMGLHANASEQNDFQLTDFIESHFLGEQIDSIYELSNYVSTLDRLKDNPLGEYLFDQQTLGGSASNNHYPSILSQLHK